MLELNQITKAYRGPHGPVRVVTDFSLNVGAGEFVAVEGPSGCGKTTVLLGAGGLLQPDSGRVRVSGTELYALRSEERARFRATRIGFVFQQFHLVPYLSVRDNVLSPSLAAPVPEAPRRVMELIERFGLAHRCDHVPAQLSTGERQRVALARALLHQPKLLLADEPTGNLDTANGAAVLDHLAAFAKAGGAVLLVTHDPRVARYAGRIARMAPAEGGSSPDCGAQPPDRRG